MNGLGTDPPFTKVGGAGQGEGGAEMSMSGKEVSLLGGESGGGEGLSCARMTLLANIEEGSVWLGQSVLASIRRCGLTIIYESIIVWGLGTGLTNSLFLLFLFL